MVPARAGGKAGAVTAGRDVDEGYAQNGGLRAGTAEILGRAGKDGGFCVRLLTDVDAGGARRGKSGRGWGRGKYGIGARSVRGVVAFPEDVHDARFSLNVSSDVIII